MRSPDLKSGWIILISLIIFALFLSGCHQIPADHSTPPTTENQPQTNPITPGAGLDYQDQVYCSIEGVDLLFDLSYPTTGDAPYPLVVYIHGGSWREGDKRGGAGMEFKDAPLDAGYAFASINYRLSPEVIFPAHIEDVKCAVRFFRANAEQLGIDPGRIAALGGSAGGHLAALLGLTASQGLWEDSGDYLGISSAVVAVVDLFGPTDLRGMTHPSYQTAFADVFGEAIQNEEAMWEYSPLAYVSDASPPFLIMHGNADQVVATRHSEDLFTALRAVGVPVELVIVHGGGHSTDLFNTNATPSQDELIEILLSFLSEHLSK